MTTIHFPLLSTALNVTDAEYEAVAPAVRGAYGRSYLAGAKAVSGADLTGKARQYSDGYKRTRDAIHAALQSAGVVLVEVVGERGRRSVWSVDALAAALGVAEPATTNA